MGNKFTLIRFQGIPSGVSFFCVEYKTDGSEWKMENEKVIEEALFRDLVCGKISEQDYDHKLKINNLRVGMRVIARNPNNILMKGIVKVTHDSNLTIGIEFDEDCNGHNLDGKSDYPDRGWYVQLPNIKKIITEHPNTF